ncbi:MAG TPA: hypothetical protein VLL52_20040 [Anaerolineae bacterium]|nr:hypothetical protein [Anaerolineae bacterium]
MQMTQLVQKLGRTDVKLIGRDRFLLFLSGFMVYIALALRWGLPWVNEYLIENGVMPGERIDFTLATTYPMLVGYMSIFTGGLIVGTVFGFVLIDEKDNNTLQAMLVTPVPLRSYLWYRAGVPALLAFVFIMASVWFVNLALLPWWQMVLVAMAGSLTAPMVTLFYALLANNKVEGFAYSKFMGIAGMTILGGWFVAEPYQWLLGIFPPFLVCKAYWLALEGSGMWWLVLVGSVVYHLVVIRGLMVLMERKVYG